MSPPAVTQQAFACQLAAPRQSRSQIGSSQHVAQPVGKNRRQAADRRSGFAPAATRRQLPAVARAGQGQQQGQLAARAVPAPRRVGTFCRQSGQPFAQDRFDRVFPAGFDVQRFPQRLAVLQPVPAQPVVQFAVGLQALLQLLQRNATSAGLGTLLLRVLDFGQQFAPLAVPDAAARVAGSCWLSSVALIRSRSSASSSCLSANRVIGGRQRLALERQAFAAAGERSAANAARARDSPARRAAAVRPGTIRRAGDLTASSAAAWLLLGQRQAFLPRFEAQLPCSTRSSATASRPCQRSSSLASVAACACQCARSSVNWASRVSYSRRDSRRWRISASSRATSALAAKRSLCAAWTPSLAAKCASRASSRRASRFTQRRVAGFEIGRSPVRPRASAVHARDCASLRRSSQSSCCLRVSSSLYSRYWRATLA
jgi:hypothetical protein